MTSNIDTFINNAKKRILNNLKTCGYLENLGQSDLRKAREIIFDEQFNDIEKYKKDLQKVKAFSDWIDNL